MKSTPRIGEGLILDGSKFWFDKAYSSTHLWRCIKNFCKARCKTDLRDLMILDGRTEHNMRKFSEYLFLKIYESENLSSNAIWLDYLFSIYRTKECGGQNISFQIFSGQDIYLQKLSGSTIRIKLLPTKSLSWFNTEV